MKGANGYHWHKWSKDKRWLIICSRFYNRASNGFGVYIVGAKDAKCTILNIRLIWACLSITRFKEINTVTP